MTQIFVKYILHFCIFRHLKLEIALAIPASNDEKYNSYTSISGSWYAPRPWSQRVNQQYFKKRAAHTGSSFSCIINLCVYEIRSKHKTLNQCWLHVGPASMAVGQNWAWIGSTSCVCWVFIKFLLLQKEVVIIIKELTQISSTSRSGQQYLSSGWGIEKRIMIDFQRIDTWHQANRQPNKRETLNQCCFNVGPASKTVDQYWNNIGSMYRACDYNAILFQLIHVLFCHTMWLMAGLVEYSVILYICGICVGLYSLWSHLCILLHNKSFEGYAS